MSPSQGSCVGLTHVNTAYYTLMTSIIPLTMSQDGCSARSCFYVGSLNRQAILLSFCVFPVRPILPFQFKYYQVSTRKISVCCICCVLDIVLSALYASSYVIFIVVLRVWLPFLDTNEEKDAQRSLHICSRSHSRRNQNLDLFV